MAYAKGKAYPILIQMSQKLPEAKKLFDDLTKIPQAEFEQRFGELLKTNPSFDVESPEETISKEAPNTRESLGKQIYELPRMTNKTTYEERLQWRKVAQDVNTKLIDNDEFGYVNYLAEKYPSFEKYKEKTNLGGNHDLQLLAKGWYKPPQVVSMDEFYQLASEKDAVLYFRGIKSYFESRRNEKTQEYEVENVYTTADILYNTLNDERQGRRE